jgi:hypothetical protein
MDYAESEITKLKKSLVEFRKLFDDSQTGGSHNNNGADGG